MIAGDFNSVLAVFDRINGSVVTLNEMKDFNDFLVSAESNTIRSIGHYFLWKKGVGNDKVESRINCGLGNDEWMQKFQEVYVK